MKLELKHFAAYWHYKLKLQVNANGMYLPYPNHEKGGHIFELDLHSIPYRTWSNPVVMSWIEVLIRDTKPILHPISDLTKDEFSFIWDNETDIESIEQWIGTPDLSNKFSYIFWQLLFENHFDIFGLIENDLAVDINTLNK